MRSIQQEHNGMGYVKFETPDCERRADRSATTAIYSLLDAAHPCDNDGSYAVWVSARIKRENPGCRGRGDAHVCLGVRLGSWRASRGHQLRAAKPTFVRVSATSSMCQAETSEWRGVWRLMRKKPEETRSTRRAQIPVPHPSRRCFPSTQCSDDWGDASRRTRQRGR